MVVSVRTLLYVGPVVLVIKLILRLRKLRNVSTVRRARCVVLKLLKPINMCPVIGPTGSVG